MAEIIEMNKKETPTVDAIVEAIGAFNPDGKNGEEIFGALLAMEDEQFEVLAPIFLSEIAKSFNDTGAQLMLANAMNTQGIKYEDMAEAYNNLFKNLDSEISDETLSPIKKDFLKQMLALIINAIGETQAVTKRVVSIPIELTEDAVMPKYAHLTDAAVDLYATEDYELKPGDQVMVHTGIKMAIPNGYAVLIQPRSGLSAKTKLRICNTPGLIDAGYRGEICVLVENVDAPIYDMAHDEELGWVPLYGKTYNIEKGERIAQARLVEVPQMAFLEVKSVAEYESDRGEGGFGSSGMK